MLGRQDDILLPRLFRQLDDLLGIVFDRIELPGKLLVFADWNLGAQHDPLADAGDVLAIPNTRRDGIYPPVDEHAKLRLAPPIQTRIFIRARPLSPLRFEILHLSHVCSFPS